MTDATIQQLTGEVDDLTRKVNDLSNLLALFMVNGLADAFDGSGNQTFGGGIVRLENKGGLVFKVSLLTTPYTRGIFWVPPPFPVDPTTSPDRLSILGYIDPGNDAFLRTTVITSSGRNTCYTMRSNAVGDQSWEFGDDAQYIARFNVNNTGADLNELDLFTTNLKLVSRTSDLSAFSGDGLLWYRSDIFRPRIRSNGITGNLAVEIQSASAAAVGNNGTITTAGVSAARVAPAGAVTGVILAVGTTGGQMCTVVNESVAASTVTFAVAGTSNVADGVASVIAGLNARTFCWDSVTALWYPVK